MLNFPRTLVALELAVSVIKRRGPFSFPISIRSASNVHTRLVAGLELEKLIRHVEVMVLVFDEQVTPAVRGAHHHHSLSSP